MFSLPTAPDDDPAFVDAVAAIINDQLRACTPDELFLVKIDHAFDRKWLAYAGNPRQHVAQWKLPLVIPPFHPNRVLSERRLTRNPSTGDYDPKPLPTSLHRRQPSALNLRRLLSHRCQSAIYVWFSGATARAKRGTLMIYFHFPAFQDAWFATLTQSSNWRIEKQTSTSAARH